MDLRMKPSLDEFEEVESPFAGKSRDKLRSRKNVFNRPFATGPSVAPAVFESTSARRSIGHPDMTDMTHHRSSSLDDTEIEYLNEDESESDYLDEPDVVVEKRPARISHSNKKKTGHKNLLTKLGWSVIGLLVLRLLFMDRGVWDYFATESAIRERKDELQSIRKENKSIATEITRIQVDKNYQRQLAKEHLGVIAAEEFLILFAGESTETSSATYRQL
jgi:cell division protein FtsB